MVPAKGRGVQRRSDFLRSSGAAVFCKPVPARFRTRAARAPFSGKAKMVMGTTVLFCASWPFPLAEVESFLHLKTVVPARAE
eukprot:7715260-Lingulodinium_polyedra.AAC.1